MNCFLNRMRINLLQKLSKKKRKKKINLFEKRPRKKKSEWRNTRSLLRIGVKIIRTQQQ